MIVIIQAVDKSQIKDQPIQNSNEFIIPGKDKEIIYFLVNNNNSTI